MASVISVGGLDRRLGLLSEGLDAVGGCFLSARGRPTKLEGALICFPMLFEIHMLGMG